MKTQIITLESHDDLISIRDKMDWAKTPRILLVIPRRINVLRPLDLRLLQRHAESLGAQLGMATTSGEMKRAASELDIPVFRSSVEAQRKSWGVPTKRIKRRTPRKDLRADLNILREASPLEKFTARARVLIFTASVFAVLFLLFLFIPSARITLSPITQVQSITLPVSASPNVESVSLSGVLPARAITVTVEGEGSALATASVSAPNLPAGGVIRFQNLTRNEVTIPRGTIVTTADFSPIRFETLEDALVAPGTDQFVDVKARALSGGKLGNVAVNTINAIEGTLGLSLTATNPAAMFGGTDTTRPAPGPADRETVYETVFAQLQLDALEQIRAQLKSGDEIFPNTLFLVQVIEEIYSPNLGEAGDEITVRLKAEFQAYYVSGDDLNYFAQSALQASLPAGYEVSRTAPLRIEAASAYFIGEDGTTRWQMLASRDMHTIIDLNAALKLVQGATPRNAINKLYETFSLEDVPLIEMTPAWFPVLPILPFRIQIDY